jgi:hypothetical protein
MARTLKVYGTSFGTRRRIVAATSKAAAARALKISTYYANGYMSDTRNAEEIALATAEPGVVFSRSNSKPLWADPFIREEN